MIMREIKFREWDPIRQEAYGKNGLSYGDREDYDDMIAFRFSHTEYMGEDLIKDRVLEQYTGLKDVNGVEIYEGDVVKLYAEVHDTFGFEITKKETGKIVFYNGAFFISNGISDEPIYAYENDFEIIGNIHEQPELLEDK